MFLGPWTQIRLSGQSRLAYAWGVSVGLAVMREADQFAHVTSPVKVKVVRERREGMWQYGKGGLAAGGGGGVFMYARRLALVSEVDSFVLVACRGLAPDHEAKAREGRQEARKGRVWRAGCGCGVVLRLGARCARLLATLGDERPHRPRGSTWEEGMRQLPSRCHVLL